jgi:nucleoside-diphosphate-sugar epimerase
MWRTAPVGNRSAAGLVTQPIFPVRSGESGGTIGSVFPGPSWLRYGSEHRPERRAATSEGRCVLPDYPTTNRAAERRTGRRDRRGAKRGDRRQRRVVAVTGGAGYIGSMLVRRLLDRGHQVRVIERFLYGDGALRDLLPHPNLALTIADFRKPHGLDRAFAGVDAVVHLGAIAGEAACALDEAFTLSTNVEATRLIATLCRALGVPRLVFASCGDVHGASDGALAETASPLPTSLYARSKRAAERLLLDHPDRRTAPVVLRLPDLYGISYRPRFDLAVNALVARAATDGQATIGGESWRPFVHVDDVARAFVAVVEAPLDRVANRVFRVACDDAAGQARELGAQLAALLPQVEVQIEEVSGVFASQPIRCEQLRAAVGFQPCRTIAAGVAELLLGIGGPLRRWRDPHHDNGAYLAQLIATQPSIVAPDRGGRLLRAVLTPPRHLRVAPLP